MKARNAESENAFQTGFIAFGRFTHRFEYKLNQLLSDDNKLVKDEGENASDQKQQYLKSLNSTAAFNKGVEYFVEIIFFYGVLICLAYYEIRKSYLASIKENKKKNLLKSNLKSLK